MEKIVDKAGYTVEIVYQSNVYEDMKELEIFLISLYGRRDLGKGALVNLTDGGDGNFGWIMPKEVRDKISKSHIGMKVPYKKRPHIDTKGEKNPFYGKTHTEETRNRISKANTGRKHTEDAVINMKKAKKGTPVGSENKSSKKIINTKTNEIYGCALDVLPIVNISIDRFRGYLNLNSKIKNPTYFMYLEDYEKYGADEPHIKNPFYKKVIDTESNIEYSSMKECSRILNIDYSSLKAMLSNKKENITTLIYQKDL